MLKNAPLNLFFEDCSYVVNFKGTLQLKFLLLEYIILSTFLYYNYFKKPKIKHDFKQYEMKQA
jgi:hypothetical protein